jgi:GntR family transcriptional regulator/MocR family aminotransferase
MLRGASELQGEGLIGFLSHRPEQGSPTACGGAAMESKEPTRSSLRNEIYRQLRARILSGQLTPGSRLPSSRALATQMGVSRNTVLAAYEQLWAEGYLEGRLGSGTYVTRSLPDELLSAAVQPPMVPGDVARGRFLSERGERIASSPRTPLPVLTGHPEVRAFTVGLPDVDTFPKEAWGRLVTRRQRESTWEMMRYNHPAGYEPLRRAIAIDRKSVV